MEVDFQDKTELSEDDSEPDFAGKKSKEPVRASFVKTPGFEWPKDKDGNPLTPQQLTG